MYERTRFQVDKPRPPGARGKEVSETYLNDGDATFVTKFDKICWCDETGTRFTFGFKPPRGERFVVMLLGTAPTDADDFDCEAALNRLGFFRMGDDEQVAALAAENDRLNARIAELERDAARAAISYNAVISYMLGDGRMEEPMEFLRCWNEGNFAALRREWPEAPEEIYLADPLADHAAIDAALSAQE